MTELRALRAAKRVHMLVGRVLFVAGLALRLLPGARAQSASITVAPIPDVAPGISIEVNWTVTNTGPASRTFGIGAEIRRNAAVLADLGAQTTGVVGSGALAAGRFLYAIPAGWSNGTYTMRAAVWTGPPGASVWLNSHDRNFTLQRASLPLSGRIGFHRDSDNHSLHPSASADDGHIFTIELSSAAIVRRTSGLGLGNCLNPHFSPDGSRLTFMAIPLGQPLLWANMRVYVLDLAATGSPLVDLGVGQDPKFSADGQRIVFKSAAGQIQVIRTDGTPAQTLTSGGVEKSGPSASPPPGEERIAYWNTTTIGAARYGDIAWRLPSGVEETLVTGSSNRYCYYPIWRDAEHILFTIAAGNDDLYEYSTTTKSYAPLAPLNTTADESDPFPAGDWVGFSSTRPANGGGGYDLYLAKADGSGFQEITAANTSLHELGGHVLSVHDGPKISGPRAHQRTDGGQFGDADGAIMVRWSGLDRRGAQTGHARPRQSGVRRPPRRWEQWRQGRRRWHLFANRNAPAPAGQLHRVRHGGGD